MKGIKYKSIIYLDAEDVSKWKDGFWKKLNKMSIEFYYIGCHRPIVLSSQLSEVDKIFRNKMSLNMSI